MPIPHYDYVIIGAGISGLLTAYRILQDRPDSSVLILEKETHAGGRLCMTSFAGVMVTTGAGVGRKHKDHLLLDLLKEMDVPSIELQPTSLPNRQQLARLRTLIARHPMPGESFAQFGQRVLGIDEYDQFIIGMGFSDMEDANARETLLHYGLDDNIRPWTVVRIPWNNLISTLQRRLQQSGGYVHYNAAVDKIYLGRLLYRPHTQHIIVDAGGHQYSAHKLVFATTADVIRTLLPRRLRQIYAHVKTQPFLRAYAQFAPRSRPVMSRLVRGTTMVANELQKLNAIDADRGIYQIAYADNGNAVNLAKIDTDTRENREIWESLVADAFAISEDLIKIDKIRVFYRAVGTHYYDSEITPEASALLMHPAPRIYVVGEAVSSKQGWTEGALETIRDVFANTDIIAQAEN
jgi:NAD(P)-binding Rossmann-like domain